MLSRVNHTISDGRLFNELYDVAAFIAIGSIPFVLISLIVLAICKFRELGKQRTSKIMITTASILGATLVVPILVIMIDNGADVEGLVFLLIPLTAIFTMALFTQSERSRPWPKRPFGFLEI
jgi:L-asparagine transporter-like permease